MDEKAFWAVIDETMSDTQDTQAAKLKTELAALSRDGLIEFNLHYRNKLAEANSWDMWAAAYIINGGCSDDGFDYFRDWLISKGQAVFDAAQKDPETLKGVATPWDTEFEEFRYVMLDIMEEVHNGEFPTVPSQKHSPPSGEEWDEDTVDTKYPKLAEWVNAKTSSSKPNPWEQAALSNSKPGFFQRLFGKK